jgi:transcriptional regulator with XRE-family HTH domain
MPEPLQSEHAAPEKAAVVGKAVVRAAAALGLKNVQLARILGVSAPTVSRLTRGDWSLAQQPKAYELAVLLVRLYRSLDSITGDDEASRSWLRSRNTALSARPIDLIGSITGLVDTVAYVDARRAPI